MSLKIERKNEFISKNMNDGSTRIENKIFMYSDNFNRNFEYVKIDNKRIKKKNIKNLFKLEVIMRLLIIILLIYLFLHGINILKAV